MLSNYEIIITSLDNPGWSINVSSPLFQTIRYQSLQKEDESEQRWFYQYFKNGELHLVGDETKLVRIFSELLIYFSIEKAFETEKKSLDFLQTWYTFECDGFWEHLYGVQGEINSDGKCRFVIDLDETYWEEEPFETVGSISTFQCRKEGAKFIGEGKLEHALFYLQTFKEWIESFNIEVLHTYDGKLYIPRNEL